MPNGWNDWDAEEELEDQEVEEQVEESEDDDPAKDVKPVNLPKKIIMIVLIGLLLGIVVVTIFAMSVQVEKEINPGEMGELENTGYNSYIENTSGYGDYNPNFSENLPENQGSVPGGTDFYNNQNNGQNNINGYYTDNQGNQGDYSNQSGYNQNGNVTQKPIQDVTDNIVQAPPEFVAVMEPDLSEYITTTGMVLSKQVYKRNQNYFYNLQISMVYGDLAQTVDYFCPKSTYDAVDSGYVLNVTYQVDSVGNFSIYSISDQ